MTPAEQKAREIAERIYTLATEGGSYDLPCGILKIESVIAQALTDFARDAVLDDREKRTADDLYKLSRESGAKSMRERCAKVLEDGMGGEGQSLDEEALLGHYTRKLKRLPLVEGETSALRSNDGDRRSDQEPRP